MTKLEYLKKCIVDGKAIEYLNWYYLAIAIPVLVETDTTQLAGNDDQNKYCHLVTKADGLYFFDRDEQQQLVLVKISDYVHKQPLFTMKDVVEIDQSWLPSVKGKLTTNFGTLIVNALVLVPSLGVKIEYLKGPISPAKIESIFIDKVKNDDVAGPNDILVREMVTCIDRLKFLENIAPLINITGTPKTITKPPSMDKERTRLVAEYKDQLTDPVKVVELETKLGNIDAEYLADDPAAANVFNKKSRNARKKMYQMYGSGQDFIQGDSKPITGALDSGLQTDPESLATYFNDLRFGSFSRGASTALSGYAYKILQRALSSVVITPTPCNTKKGILRLVSESNYKLLNSRYIALNGKWHLVTSPEEAKAYIGKMVTMRSAMYCENEGNSLCYACVSESYKTNESGATNIAANISDSLMKLFLKLNHSSAKEIVSIDFKDLVT